MEAKSSNQKPTKLVRYPLASAGRRLAVKILDILFLSLIIFGLGCAILLSGNPTPKDLTTYATWRYAVLAGVSFILFILYFLIIPYFSKKTLFMKAFKLQYVNNLPLSNFMFGLIKHEILIWGIISILSLIVGIVLAALTPANAANMLRGIAFRTPAQASDNNVFFYVGTGFAAAYIVALLVVVGIIIGVFTHNKKPAFHDKFSNVFVIYLSATNTPDKQTNTKKQVKTKINYGVPGEISSGAFEEIDEL